VTDRVRCLVLGSKQALDRLAPALDQVIEALALTRAPVLSPGELASGELEADVVVAEVTKPPPTIAFELGLAAAKRIPVVYLVAEGSTPAPVFEPYVTYDATLPAARTAFRIAKQVESVLDGTPLAGSEPWSPAYSVGERFIGIVSHVDPDGGYALVHTPGRPGALLHVTRMAKSRESTREGWLVAVGDAVYVKVVDVNVTRRAVYVEEEGRVSSAPPSIVPVAALYRHWADLDALVREIPTFDVESHAAIDQERPTIDLIREVRNRLAHGEAVLPDLVDSASMQAARIVERLRDLAG
jgi:hypothetical protein